ncbi:MAG: pyruvate dehydrogenase complex dihydrolipoamide acetyltransferase [Gemmatimonadota bacterium]|nr:pyruvate dehydrogenase complex dihydrolipoamide acetyltransferase [Gemmatimonadota bacterium]
MATKVVMAQLSPTMEEGKLVEWKVSEGDEVSQGDVVAEIETDKANMEVEALGGGVLRKIVVDEGETVPVGALIGVIADPDEDIDDIVGEAGAKEPAEAKDEEDAPGPGDEEEASGEEEAEPEPASDDSRARAKEETDAGDEAEAASPREETDGGERIKASPVARRMAADAGIDLASLSGSGPNGRIVKADVESAIAEAPEQPEEGEDEEAPPEPIAAPRLEGRVEEASPMRKAIARRLVQSIGPVPHFFLTTEIDMGRALELRADLNERFERGKIGVNDLLLKATAEALARHPGCNASWEENEIRYHGSVDLGIAVAVDGGLITPVLREAERKGLRRISTEARDLISRAREKKLQPEEYQGGTFSVSNLGMFDIDQFTAIINPPEAGILAIGQTVEKPVVVDGEVVVRKRMRVTMSCDHRVIDGASGAEFLGTFKAMLENPLEMIL